MLFTEARRMEVVTVELLLLFLLLITRSAGARLLDDDSNSHMKKSTTSHPELTKASLTHSDAKSAITSEILRKESIPLSLMDHEEQGRAQNGSDEDQIVFSGQSPGAGHSSIQEVHVEGILSSGQSPGVGHYEESSHNAHNKGMVFSGQSPNYGEMTVQDAHFEGMLSSGQSPGVGHMSVQHSQGAEEAISRGSGHVIVIEEMHPSGGNPGVGHMSLHNVPKQQILSSEESPDVGHMGAQDDHIGGILPSRNIDSEKKMSTLNQLPSGSSPGVGHMVINTRQKRKGPAASSALGNVEKTVGAEDKTVESTGHVKESGAPKGGVSETSEGEMKETMGHSAGEERRNGGQIIGCAGVGVGQPSRSINLFDESSYYGAPTPLLFGITGKDRDR